MMMLAQWGEIAAVKSIQQAWNSILDRGYRTVDLNPEGKEVLVSTQELVELFLALLKSN